MKKQNRMPSRISGFLFLILIAALVSVPEGNAQTMASVGVSIGEKGLSSFHLAIGAYFRVPETDVRIVQQRRIPDEEIPVVFLIAARARVSPNVVINLKLGGKSWMEIALHYGLAPDVFYVPVQKEIKGPPYGKAYGYYKNKHPKDSGRPSLRDDDVVNLVNLKFLSEHYGLPPEHVIQMRSEGKNFVNINGELEFEKGNGKGKSGKEGKQASQREEPKGRGKGKWK